MYIRECLKKQYLFLLVVLASSFALGQSIFTNPITGTNPNTSDPYTTGQTVDGNITVSGIGRGPGISGVNADNKYNANNWNLVGLNTDDYFEFTLTPDNCYEIDLVSFEYTSESTALIGPASFAFRCSVDSYSSNIGSPNATGTTIDLSAYQDISEAITFRFYAWGGLNLLNGHFSINDFTFNGVVSAPTTTWSSGSWSSGVPTIGTTAVIDDDFDTGIGGDQTSFSVCSLIINAGSTLTIDNNTYIEVEYDVSVDGELYVDTKGSFVQNSSSGLFTINSGGNAEVYKSTAVKQEWYYYTYWSSPVVGAIVDEVFPSVPSSRRFWFNANSYVDTGGDDIDDNGDDWAIANGANAMTPGVGYAMASSPSFSHPLADNATFSGQFNNGDVSTGIVYNALNAGSSWNLIGNPYPSAIDFDAFYAANSSVIDGAAYFWSQSLPPLNSNPGNEVLNFNQNDYATYTVGSGGVAGASGVIPSQYIPSCQGFFVAGLTNGNVTFTNTMRMVDGTSNVQFFRGSDVEKNSIHGDNKLWLNLTSNHGTFNQILIAYVDGATNGYDGLSYDAPRLLTQDFSTTLYSTMANKKFAVQGKAPNSLTPNEIIRLGFVTNITNKPIVYILSLAQLQGSFMTSRPIYLKDTLLGTIHNLSNSDYGFTSGTGEFNNRFIVGFNAHFLASNGAIVTKTAMVDTIYLKNGNIQFKSPTGLEIKEVSFFDMLGRELYVFNGQKGSGIYDLSTMQNSVYITRVALSDGTIITKKGIIKD